jgi:hypothetical protein
MWTYNNTLCHWGRKGMKWGQRIFSDDNLSRTKGLLDASSSLIEGSKRVNASVGQTRASLKRTKNPIHMTDDELRARVNRMNLEQQYSNLSANRIQKGHITLENVLNIAGGVLAIGSSAATIALAIKQFKTKVE